MPKAFVDPRACRPERCDGGRCRVRRSCPTKAIQQIEPYEPPSTDPDRCHGCFKCVPDCPAKAISLT